MKFKGSVEDLDSSCQADVITLQIIVEAGRAYNFDWTIAINSSQSNTITLHLRATLVCE